MDTNGTNSSEEKLVEEVRTLFLSGLPVDVKPRELDLLFLPYDDYEGALLKFTNKQGKPPTPVAFCTFCTRDAAEKAKCDLQGLKFDLDLPQTMRLEFAKSNTKMTRKQANISNMIATNTTSVNNISGFSPNRTVLQPLQATNPATPPYHLDPWMAAGYNSEIAVVSPGPYPTSRISPPATLQFPGVTHPEVLPTSVGRPLTTVATLPSTTQYTTTWAHSPCNTLFVGNLGTYTTEQELREVFSRCPGFRRLRLHLKGSTPVAFVEFTDETHAENGLSSLQGFHLLSSERGGVRIEFARNRMGDRATMEAGVSMAPTADTIQPIVVTSMPAVTTVLPGPIEAQLAGIATSA